MDPQFVKDMGRIRWPKLQYTRWLLDPSSVCLSIKVHSFPSTHLLQFFLSTRVMNPDNVNVETGKSLQAVKPDEIPTVKLPLSGIKSDSVFVFTFV